MSDTPLTDYLEFDPYIEAHILKKIEELERENAALREDKERLDWLEGHEASRWCAKWINGGEWLNRAAIDAARKEQP